MQTAIFRQQHAAIRDLLNAIDVDDSLTAPHAYATLVRLTATIKAHLKFEDEHLYPVLLDSPDFQIRNKAARFQKEIGMLGAGFAAFSTRWLSSRSIADDLPGFTREWTSIAGALRDRMEREDNDLYAEFDRLQAA